MVRESVFSQKGTQFDTRGKCFSSGLPLIGVSNGGKKSAKLTRRLASIVGVTIATVSSYIDCSVIPEKN